MTKNTLEPEVCAAAAVPSYARRTVRLVPEIPCTLNSSVSMYILSNLEIPAELATAMILSLVSVAADSVVTTTPSLSCKDVGVA